jgi:nitroreductase
LIVLDYHRLEKGLSLSRPRTGFGTTAATDLQRNLFLYIQHHEFGEVCSDALKVLREYYAFNHAFCDDGNPLYCGYQKLIALSQAVSRTCPESSGGTEEESRKNILAAVNIDYARFFQARHSIRAFSGESVERSLIEKAGQIAQNAPSVCNRQPWKLYCVEQREMIEQLLVMHGGARGFEGETDKLLVVSVDMRAFHYSGERNECWIDGGIYTMSLLNALHSVGLGACCLNWCVERGRDRRLRDLLEISPSEVIIVVVAVGNLCEKFKVPVSPRKTMEQVIVYK